MASAAKHRLPEAGVRALVEARHEDPFAVLGPHEVAGGIVIRALVPGAVRLEVVEEGAGAVVGELESAPRGGPVRGRARGPAGLVRLHAARAQRGRLVGGARPLPLPTGPGRDGRLSHRRGHASALVGASRRARDRACRRGGGPFRGLGAQRRSRLGGRRLQRLGRAAQPDAAARRGRRLGDLHPRARRGGGLQVRAARRRRLAAALEGGPGRHRGGAAAAERVGGPAGRRLHLGRCGLAGAARRRPGGHRSGQHPRGASRLLGARRGQPVPDL